MNNHNSLSSNWISSQKWYLEILGALILSKVKAFVNIIMAFAIVGGIVFYKQGRDALYLVAATLIVWLVWQVVRALTPIYCLRKKESRITWSQICLLLSFGVWLLVFIKILNVDKDSPSYIIVSVIGVVLGWVFQDTIKSVVAFFYLRANDLLKIGDWIEVPARGIDGMVKGITLTTVTIDNWDTTTSAFPTYILHSEYFKNSQKMMEGKTHGRQMKKTFIIDTGWIHTMSKEELDRLYGVMDSLSAEKKNVLKWFVEKHAKPGVLNIELYRLYIYHWLMHHQHVSHEPRLIVRWLEQVPEGMPLQIYAFITDSNFAPFEWQQSQIIEHAIEALAWFNLQLYQAASGYDASNSNITLVEEKADYRRQFKNNGEIL